MEQMQDDGNSGAQIIVIQKYFLHVNNFRHADILHVHGMQFGNQFVEPFFIFAVVYFIDFSILNWEKIQSEQQIVFRLTYTKGDQYQGMGFTHRASSTWQYEEKWNYRAFFLNLRIYELTSDNYSVSSFFPYIFFPYIYETGLNVSICRIFERYLRCAL